MVIALTRTERTTSPHAVTWLLLVVLALSGCNEVTGGTLSGDPAPVATVEEGETVEAAGFRLTADEFRAFGGGPEPTPVWFIVDIALTNLRDSPRRVSPGDWEVRTPAGELIGPDRTTEFPDRLAAGGSLEESLEFEFDSTEGEHALVFSEDGTIRVEWPFDVAASSDSSPEPEDPTADPAEALGLVSEGTLSVCTDSPYPPMVYQQGGRYTGFEIELTRAVAEEIGLDDVTVVNSPFERILSGDVFAADECDIAAAAITITVDRSEKVAFSEPYFDAPQSLLTMDASGYSSLQEMAGRHLGVQSDTTGAAYARSEAPASTDVVEFEHPGVLWEALEAGDVAGALQDLVINAGLAQKYPQATVVETYPVSEHYAFAVDRGAGDDLLTEVNEALAAVMASSEYESLYREYFPGIKR